jgi:hypothetical protein
LQCPSSGEPPTLKECYAVSSRASTRHRHIGDVYVAPHCLVIPAKHGVDRFQKLCAARLVDAAGVDPEVMEAILCSLLPAEGKL